LMPTATAMMARPDWTASTARYRRGRAVGPRHRRAPTALIRQRDVWIEAKRGKMRIRSHWHTVCCGREQQVISRLGKTAYFWPSQFECSATHLRDCSVASSSTNRDGCRQITSPRIKTPMGANVTSRNLCRYLRSALVEMPRSAARAVILFSDRRGCW